MPLDPIIAAGFKGLQLQDPLEQYARVNALQQAQQQNALNALKMQEYQRGVEQQNRLRALNPNAATYISDVMQIDPKFGSELQLRQAQQSAAQRAEAASRAEARAKNLTYWQGLARDAAGAPTDDVLKSLASKSVELEIVDEPTASAQLQQILALPPEQRSQVLSRYGAPATLPKEPAPRASTLMTPEEEAQRIRIARESRPPAQPREPREPAAPVAVVDEATGRVKYVTREEAIGKTPAAQIEGLTPKERQKREALFPKAKQAVATVETNMGELIKDLETLASHPGLNGITGVVYGRTPSLTAEAREAQALYDKIVARGGFQELQNMRAASPTGGALGNVSNQEGQQLKQSFAEIGREQATGSVRKALLRAAENAKLVRQRAREAFEDTYEYRQGGAAAPAATPATTKSGATVSNW